MILHGMSPHYLTDQRNGLSDRHCNEDKFHTRIHRLLGNNVTDSLKETVTAPGEPAPMLGSPPRTEPPMQRVDRAGGPSSKWRPVEFAPSASPQLQDRPSSQGAHTSGPHLVSHSSVQKQKLDDGGSQRSGKHSSKQHTSRPRVAHALPEHAQECAPEKRRRPRSPSELCGTLKSDDHSPAHGQQHHDKKRSRCRSPSEPRVTPDDLGRAQAHVPKHLSSKHARSRSPHKPHNLTKVPDLTWARGTEQQGKNRLCSRSPSEAHVASEDPGHTRAHVSKYCSSKHACSRSPQECNASQDSVCILPSLIEKLGSLMQKPTAYVRPMDGQDTRDSKRASEYNIEAELKDGIQTCLSELKSPMQLLEASIPGVVERVDENLKGKTQSWTPLSAVHTPGKTEPLKLRSLSKDAEQPKSPPIGEQEKNDSDKTSPLSGNKPTVCDVNRSTLLQEDLRLSSSEDSDDDQNFAKNPTKNAAGSSQSKMVEQLEDNSSSSDSSSSNSDSSSESDSDSSSSDSEANEPSCDTVLQPEPPTANMWQLDNWLQKDNKMSPVSPPDISVITKKKTEVMERTSGRGYYAKEGSKDPGISPPSKDKQAATKIAHVAHRGEKSHVQTDGNKIQHRTMNKKQPKKSEKPPGVNESQSMKTERMPISEIPPKLPKAAIKSSQKPSIKKEPKSSSRQASNKRKYKTPGKALQKCEASMHSGVPSLDTEESPSIPSISQIPNHPLESVKENSISPKTILSFLEEMQPISPLSNTNMSNRKELMVKIDLNLLFRAPGESCKELGPPRVNRVGTNEKEGKHFQKRSGNKVTSQMKRKSKVLKPPDNRRGAQPLTSERSKSQRLKLRFNERLYSADEYLQKAKILKHKADAQQMDRFEKAVYYLDAVTSFIECGDALEKKVEEGKSPYPMYAETVELIRYTMKLRSYMAPDATAVDKRLAVLCLRCQALLRLRLFKLRKESALRYSKVLTEHMKNFMNNTPSSSPGMASQAMNTPSPHSPAAPAAHSSSSSTTITSSFVTIPQSVHQMATSYVQLTSNLLNAVELWDQADQLGKEEKEFFSELDKVRMPLMFNSSSIMDLVRYTRQALYWMREDANLLH